MKKIGWSLLAFLRKGPSMAIGPPLVRSEAWASLCAHFKLRKERYHLVPRPMCSWEPNNRSSSPRSSPSFSAWHLPPGMSDLTSQESTRNQTAFAQTEAYARQTCHELKELNTGQTSFRTSSAPFLLPTRLTLTLGCSEILPQKAVHRGRAACILLGSEYQLTSCDTSAGKVPCLN